MRIDWEESAPTEVWLPKKTPTRGLLAGERDFPAAAHFDISKDISPLPPPRSTDPLVRQRLEEYHREAGASEKTLAGIGLLGSGAQAVVTGQQTGLLGGPLFTVLKALTAIRLADRLTTQEQRPYVPVFWAEGEDHDIEEVNQVTTLDGNFDRVRLELPCPEEYRQGPAGFLPLGGPATELVNRFFEASAQTEFTGDLRRRVMADLEGSERLSRWFSKQLLRFFGDRGLVVLESCDRRYKELARPFWAGVLEDPLALTESVGRVGEDLSRLGYRPVLVKHKRRCPFFLISEGRRLPVFYERGSFRVNGKYSTLLEMRTRLEERPQDFSPGVNLRPLLQDWLLPTAAYVGGPTELGYFLQVLPGYDWAKIPPPALCLRAGLTLVEPSVRKFLRHRKIEPADLRGGIDGVLNAALRRENRLGDPARWEKLRLGTARPLERFLSGLSPAEQDMAELALKTQGKVDFLVRELEKKFLAGLRRRSEVLRTQLARSRKRLFPGGSLQERALSPYYFMNKYGPGFLETLAEDLPTDFTRHFFGTIIP